MFCNELRKFREDKSMTAAELGKKIGITAAGVLRNEQPGAVRSYWRYTRRLNAVFGTNFPDMSHCRVCGCEIKGCAKICPACAEEKKKKKHTENKAVSLHDMAKDAQKANLSYGELAAGITRIKPERTNEAPVFLNLGRTIAV